MDDSATHHHAVPRFNLAFLIAITANGLFVICQIFFAYVANSTSLFADAIHNLGDVLSLMVAWVGNSSLKRQPTDRSTYGMKKISILAALANGVLLIFTCGIIVSEAMYKFFSPAAIDAFTVMSVAAVGIGVNGATALLFLRGMNDLNIRAAFMHLVADALISIGVVFSAILLYWTGWLWIDPAVGLIIAAIILKSTWSLFADSFRLIIDGVPRGISLIEVRELLKNQAGVRDVHDLHIWALSTQENALSVHLWMPEEPLSDLKRQELIKKLRKEYHIQHVTIQIERNRTHCEDTCLPYL
ncbi:cation transporter [Legionella septentrionalis]|uniref:Cation transporter n=2 Tax=Legionellaceae TaxID=444 RepID=A0A3S0VBP7_9GAMM|nr:MULTISPECIES: cation diffusion facilitator family transporter [Legionella]MCP0913895.1 cation diffusion facilitator family transporter [Legionella sp. 27cVA30]RUQ90436.1 cation transporter [Legionella septentrionalis]RUQ94679.1 cation transporter [Legionella septentrionalis]RUR10782.1 cation transporter [Legionella septentrionalis]RUR16464.1 cation transporter [Legionella septentrionalis]